MCKSRRSRVFRVLTLASAIAVLAVACGGSQKPVAPRLSAELKTKLDAFDARLEAKRKELGIPGLAVVIVKDDQIVYLAGKGLRDVEKQLPVSEDTLFAIGSTTKAFTAMLALMAAEEGKLSLDDPPRKCLPYFKLKDPDADAKIKLRDLLTHTSGVARTDLAWMTGKISSKEAIELAGKAEPVAALGKEFHYQNVMYLAAGECIAGAMGKPYKALLKERIFDRIGMKTANASVAETLGLPTRAVGYGEFGKDKELRPVPMRPLDNIAPAGAINASARDMGQWLRVMLARGKHGPQPLISEASFAQLFKPYIEMGPNVGYGLGWGIAKWNDRVQATHTGGIDGFVTLVALLPDENVGFGLFTNIQNADIHGYVTNEVFSLFTGDGAAGSTAGKAPATGTATEAGTYGVIGGTKMEVTWDGDKLTLEVPGQPAYGLEHVDGRRYRLGAPAPAGFFVTFRDSDSAPGKAELFLEQPHGNMTLARLTKEAIAEAEKQPPPPELAELIGSYEIKDKGIEVRVAATEGRVGVIVAGQPPLPLVLAGKDKFTLAGMPEGFVVEAKRDAAGAVSALVLNRPGSSTEATRVAGGGEPTITIDELMAKAAAAHGAEALAKHQSMVVHSSMALINQGLEGKETLFRRAPNLQLSEATVLALGREIGTAVESFDGKRGVREISFIQTGEFSPAENDAALVAATFNPWGDWRTGFEEVRVSRASKVGDEEVYVVEKKRASGVEITEYYSQQSFLLVKSTVKTPGEQDGPPEAQSMLYSDYRDVGGFLFAHRTEQSGGTGLGKIIVVVDKVELDVDIPDDKFSVEKKQ